MGWQQDEPYIEYDELVEAGEIDPKTLSQEDFVADYWAGLIDHIYEQEKDRRMFAGPPADKSDEGAIFIVSPKES